MANKKELLKNLVGGITGEEKHLRKGDEEGHVAPEVAEQLEIPSDLLEKLNKERTKGTGRPRKGSIEIINDKKEYESRATFVVDSRLIRKIKYISLMDSRLLKDIIAEALGGYIEAWEKENGKITLPNKIITKE